MKESLGLALTEKTLPQYLKEQGYTTGMIGKWHLGGNPQFMPTRRGFDECFGFLHGANSYITARTPGGKYTETEDVKGTRIPEKRLQPVYRNETSVDESEYLTEAFAREATAFLDRHHDKPFLLYMPFNAVHTPLQATTKYLDRVANIADERHRALAAMTIALDDAIGAVLNRLRQHKIEDDTMIFFLSDNGCPTYTRAGSNGPLNGSKITYYEGGIRVPFLMQWKSAIPGGQIYRHPIVSRDVLPTMVTAAGGTLPKDREIDGVDLIPFVSGKKKNPPHEWLFWRAGRNHAARYGSWKLILHGEDQVKLYDMAEDLGEKNNVAAANPDVVKKMRAQLTAWSSLMKKPGWAPRSSPTVPVNGEQIVWDL